METLITILQVLLSLSILVTLHECGHFFPAKWFKTKVDKFYLFFDPWFSLFKVQRGETEYGIGWLPLGGYVKIAGMIDESMDKEQMEGPVQPWEFRAKPAWQRLIIMLGGVIVNFVLGFFLLMMVMWLWGISYTPNDAITEGIYVDELGYDFGLRDGDKILKVGEKEMEKFKRGTLISGIIIDGAKNLTVERAGEIVEITVQEKYIDELASLNNSGRQFFDARIPSVIKEIEKKSPAQKIGLATGDKIIGLANKEISYIHEFNAILDSLRGTETSLSVIKQSGDTTLINLGIPKNGPVGVFWKMPRTEYQKFGFLESIPKGFDTGVGFLGSQIKAFKLMFQGKMNPNKSLGSIISIGKLYGTTWDWRNFWYMTAILSLILAVMNLLPIPALDGGHVMFLLWEIITGRKVNEKVLEYATLAGFFFLIILTIYVFGLDISRLF